MKTTRDEVKAHIARSRDLERSGEKVVRGLRKTARALRESAARSRTA